MPSAEKHQSAKMDIISLPTEALIYIFKKLEHQDLKHLTETCKKFKEIIQDSPEFGNLSHITIDFEKLSYSRVSGFSYKESKKDFEALLKSARNFQNFSILNINYNNLIKADDKWLEVFKKFSESAKNLRVKSDFRLESLKALLQLLPNLTALELDGFRVYKTEAASETFVQLKDLKHLKVKNFQNGSAVVQLFKNCNNLKTFTLSGVFLKRESLLADFFDDFLSNQNRLETLELYSVDSPEAIVFHKDVSENIMFDLKKLTFDYNGYSSNLQNFYKFLCSQTDLKTLKLNLSLINTETNNHVEDCKCCDDIFKFVFSLKRLNSLNIFIDRYSTKNLEVFNVINKNVTSLTFEEENRKNNRLLIRLLTVFPNLKYLELAIYHYSDELLDLISTYLKKLEHIKIVGYYNGILSKLDCIDLKSLTVKYAYTKSVKEDWIQFLRHNPNVNKISIENCIDFIDDETVTVITHNLPLLKHFETIDSYSNNLTENAFKIFHNNCKRLQYLKLTGISAATGPYHTIDTANRINVRIVVIFYFIAILFFIILVLLMLYQVI
jgi:hypothetical protein